MMHNGHKLQNICILTCRS